MFSPQQDVEVGHPVSRAAERQVPMLNDCRVEYYLNTLGFRRMRPMGAVCLRVPFQLP